MRKTLQKYGLLLLVTVAFLFAAVGCDLGGSGNNDNQSKIIKIADIVFGEDGVTVKYEDGYEIYLSEQSLLESPFRYHIATGSLVQGGLGKVEFATASTVTKEPVDEKPEDSVDDGQKENDGKDTEKEDVYEGVVEYVTVIGGGVIEFNTFYGEGDNLIYGTMLSGAMGVRVMGTDDSVIISYIDRTDSTDDLASAGSSSGSFTSIVGSTAYMEIDGKQYECYDNDPRFAEYFATRLVEVTIPESISDVKDQVVEIKSILSKGFENMTALTTVHIPASITDINTQAFSGCTSLTDLFFDGTMEQWNVIKKGKGWDENTGEYTVHCTDGDIEKGTENTDTEKGDDFMETLPDDKDADAGVEEKS
jgi:hypothetical protein